MTTTTIISSQSEIIEARVEAHLNDSEFVVLLSPAFEIDGETYQVVLDGHHRLEAASRLGVAPTYEIATTREHDAVAMLESGDIEGFLDAAYVDCEYHSVETGASIW